MRVVLMMNQPRRTRAALETALVLACAPNRVGPRACMPFVPVTCKCMHVVLMMNQPRRARAALETALVLACALNRAKGLQALRP